MRSTDSACAAGAATSESAAQPFFYSVYNTRKDEIREAIAAAVAAAFES